MRTRQQIWKKDYKKCSQCMWGKVQDTRVYCIFNTCFADKLSPPPTIADDEVVGDEFNKKEEK